MRRNLALLLVVLILTGILFSSCLSGYFLADDFGYVHLYSKTPLSKFPALLHSDWSQGIWEVDTHELRPLVGLSYWTEYRLWGTEALGYHAANLAYYLAGVTGFYLLLLEMTASRLTASIAATLYAVHPAHVEAVAWIAGRTDLLSAAAMLWSLYALLRYWRDGSRWWGAAGIACYAIAVFCKESAVIAPGLFAAWVILTGGLPRRLARFFAISMPLTAIAGLWYALHDASVPDWEAWRSRLPYYNAQTFPEGGTLWLWGIAAVALIVAFRHRQTRTHLAFWGLAWPALTLLPLTAVIYDSPRHVFLLVGAPIVLLAMFAHVRRFGWIVCLVLAAFWSYRTFTELQVWQQASAYSRELHEIIRSTPIPDDAVLVFTDPPPVKNWFWNWSLPFALQPPFVERPPARFVSFPDWYCCPSWGARKEALLQEMQSQPIRRVHIGFDATQGKFVRSGPEPYSFR